MAIQTVKYFNGEIELVSIYPIKNKEFEKRFPDIVVNRKGIFYDSFNKLVGHPANSDGTTDKSVLLPVTRRIDYKKNPSLHKCDARCMGAKGNSCECSCGGKNHGVMA